MNEIPDNPYFYEFKVMQNGKLCELQMRISKKKRKKGTHTTNKRTKQKTNFGLHNNMSSIF